MPDKRLRILKEGVRVKGPVLYWMSRDQRVEDNWALLYAQEIALEINAPVCVVFNLVSSYLEATPRHYDFMLEGLVEVQQILATKNIPFFLLTGDPEKNLPVFIAAHDVSLLITDFDPLRIKQQWRQNIMRKIKIPVHEVDTHNIVPCWKASPKQEYGAYTIRPKIHRLLEEYLEEIPRLTKHRILWEVTVKKIDWQGIRKSMKIDSRAKEVSWIKPGAKAARKVLGSFIDERLEGYDAARNDPNTDGQSNLSAYLHYGQLSAQRVALEVQQSGAKKSSRDAFLEELIVRRELSDNFCFYQPHYDSFEGFPDWAKDSLNQHRKDKRDHRYNLKEFENADTHDRLWNAAELEMIKTGKMHGYLRMYWAKKILEWSGSPEEALEIAIYLNDRYELDGRDPNGYTGVMWSIGGVHDRAWPSRPVFGKIRYMSYNGARSKFDVDAYIKRIDDL